MKPAQVIPSPATAAVSAGCTADPSPIWRCRIASATVHEQPRADARAASALLYGETFIIDGRRDDWAIGRCAHDGYPGAVRLADLDQAGAHDPTHWVSLPQTHVFAAPDIKSEPVLLLPLGARLCLTGRSGDFFSLSGGGFLHHRSVRALADRMTDPVAVAEACIGTPYLWGGRSRAGWDCSGLVQLCLAACGLAAPRDSGEQQSLGVAVDPANWASGLQRGDLIFFPGHVGFMADDRHLLHANAYWMTTLVEPLSEVIGRLLPRHAEPITAVRRLKPIR